MELKLKIAATDTDPDSEETELEMRTPQIVVLAFLIAMLPCGVFAQAPASAFRVGAAKIDITPTQLPKNSEGILDHIYARAIVIDNGTTSAALVSVDTGMLGEQVWRTVSQRIEKELGIPAKNLIINPTHTHSASGGSAEQIFNVIKAAKEKLQPARIGYGTGVSYINVQRDIIDRKTNKWWEGANYDGPSDKTVAVIKFETIKGEPIAVYFNYACHAVVTGNTDMVSGDCPGASERYIEDSFDDKIVAVFSAGAQGDQNPIYFQQTFDLRDIRIKDYAARGQDISNAMPPGGQGLNKQDPTVKKLLDQQKMMIKSMGQMHGRRGQARDARNGSGSHGDRRQNIRGSEDDQLPRPRPDRPGARRGRGHVQGWTGRPPSLESSDDRRHRDWGLQCGDLQHDCREIQERVSHRQVHLCVDGQWQRQFRIYSG